MSEREKEWRKYIHVESRKINVANLPTPASVALNPPEFPQFLGDEHDSDREIVEPSTVEPPR
jgi:hypothetical protein